MRLKAEDLPGNLRELKPVYLICGDEPFLVEEAVGRVIAAATAAGFDDRQRLFVETGFSWASFRENLSSPSLFAPRSLYELRAREGREALGRELMSCLPALTADTVLLVVTGALERNTLKAEWVEACARLGHVVVATTLQGERLVAWVRHGLRQIGVQDEEMARRIGYYAEGNMGAAAGAIARLKDEPTRDLAALSEIMGDEARFDVFAVTEAALKGDLALTLRYTQRLRQEARDPILISWAVAREVRLLYRLAALLAHKRSAAELFQRERVWASRQSVLLAAARRLSVGRLRGLLQDCTRLDRVNKGRAEGDSWLLIEDVAMGLAGMPGRDH